MLNIEIKILGVNELNDFRVIRLSALAKVPEMFGSTYSIEVVKPLSFLSVAYLVLRSLVFITKTELLV